jgi:hypothetical protein
MDGMNILKRGIWPFLGVVLAGSCDGVGMGGGGRIGSRRSRRDGSFVPLGGCDATQVAPAAVLIEVEKSKVLF